MQGQDHGASPLSPGVAEWPRDGLERLRHCPACQSPERAALYAGLTDENSHCAPGQWTLWRCLMCNSAYLDPRPTRPTISLAYRSYYTHDGLGHEELSRVGGLLFATLSAKVGTNRLVDVGSGTGALVLRARQLGWDAQGVEPDDAAVRAARVRGAPTTHGSVDALEKDAYDAITMNHVIEHMHDPIDALRACRDGLRPGGSVWLATPNVRSLGHRLFRTAWYGLDPPRHLVIFSQRGLAAALDAAGFGHIEWRPSVQLSEAFVRVQRVVRHRRIRAQGQPPVSNGGTRAPESRMARKVARHHVVHAGLRATELVAPGTADELLVRAWA
jgi:SAM-dependent methyltransferase